MLDGEWTMVSMEQKGTKAAFDTANRFKLTIRGDEWIVSSFRGMESKMTFTIDPMQNPQAIDLTMKSGNQEAVSRGIFKIEGDTLTVCRTVGDTARPKEFKTTPESGILIEWKRAGN